MNKPGQPLSDDEHLMMELLARGKSIKEIAAFLEQPETALGRRSEHVREKLGAATMVQAMHIWTRGLEAYRVTRTLSDEPNPERKERLSPEFIASVEQARRNQAEGISEEPCP